MHYYALISNYLFSLIDEENSFPSRLVYKKEGAQNTFTLYFAGHRLQFFTAMIARKFT